MKKKHIDHDMPIGKLTRIQDNLPAPAELAHGMRTTRVTIMLNRASIDFFKQEANKHHTKYQKMIRELLDQYVARYHTV